MQSRTRASVVCVYDSKLLVFKGIDPTSRREYWFLPGGKIEAGESPADCCAREAREETGYKLRIVEDSAIIAHYKHWWDGTRYDCETHFFKGLLDEPWRAPIRVDDVDYNKGPAWLPLTEIEAAFSYTPEILDAVQRLIRC